MSWIEEQAKISCFIKIPLISHPLSIRERKTRSTNLRGKGLMSISLIETTKQKKIHFRGDNPRLRSTILCGNCRSLMIRIRCSMRESSLIETMKVRPNMSQTLTRWVPSSVESREQHLSINDKTLQVLSLAKETTSLEIQYKTKNSKKTRTIRFMKDF